MYKVKILSSEQFDNLPYKRAKDVLGIADTNTGVAFVRKTGLNRLDKMTLDHEILELTAKVSPHDEDGIRYKSKSPDPTDYIVPAPKYKTADELFEEAIAFAQENYPEAYGARESALRDIGLGPDFYKQFGVDVSPEYYEGYQPKSFTDIYEKGVTPEFFKQFGPTSFEEALADKALSRTGRTISGALSKSGMAYSPELARQLGQEAFGLDSYLAQLGQRRGELALQTALQLGQFGQSRAESGLQYGHRQAETSLANRYNIDPYNVTGPYANTALSQSNMQIQANYQAELDRANAEYLKAQGKAMEKKAKISAIASIAGAGIGFVLGGPMGAALVGGAIGASVGGTAGTLFGGGQPPLDMGTALALANLSPGKTAGTTGTGGNGVGGFDIGSAKITGKTVPVNQQTGFPQSPYAYNPFGTGG